MKRPTKQEKLDEFEAFFDPQLRALEKSLHIGIRRATRDPEFRAELAETMANMFAVMMHRLCKKHKAGVSINVFSH